VPDPPCCDDAAVTDEDRTDEDRTDEELPDDVAAVLAQRPRWPAPDLHTLRAVVELELALDTDVTLDAAHAVVTDLAERAFGRRLFDWLGESLVAEGAAEDDLRLLLVHDHVAERVLERLRGRMREDDAAPDPPGEEFGWYAYPPDVSAGRAQFRRAVRRRRESARLAAVLPRRQRVAGRRRRDR
jgi:hypothetical protein